MSSVICVNRHLNPRLFFRRKLVKEFFAIRLRYTNIYECWYHKNRKIYNTSFEFPKLDQVYQYQLFLSEHPDNEKIRKELERLERNRTENSGDVA